jgi:hypothetical protein
VQLKSRRISEESNEESKPEKQATVALESSLPLRTQIDALALPTRAKRQQRSPPPRAALFFVERDLNVRARQSASSNELGIRV